MEMQTEAESNRVPTTCFFNFVLVFTLGEKDKDLWSGNFTNTVFRRKEFHVSSKPLWAELALGSSEVCHMPQWEKSRW